MGPARRSRFRSRAAVIVTLASLPDRDRAGLRPAVDEMAQEGMRVLAVARASVPAGFARPKRRAIFLSSSSASSALRIRCARPYRQPSRSAVPPVSG